MDAWTLKKELSGIGAAQLAEVLEVLELELRERELTGIADEVLLARGMLLRRLFGDGRRIVAGG